MKRVNESTEMMGKYAGKWVAIDYKKDRIVAVGDNLKDIGPLVSSTIHDRNKRTVAAFKVPYKDECRYLVPSPITIESVK